MTARLHRPRSIAASLVLLVGVPMAVGLAVLLLDRIDPGATPAPDSAVEQRVQRVERFFGDLSGEAVAVAGFALETSASEAYHGTHGPMLAGRLEGIGIFLGGEDYYDWEGTPAELSPSLRSVTGPAWRIRREGLRTRLVALTGPDDTNRCASATFLLDSKLGDARFEDMLPPETAGDESIVLRLVDSDDPPTPAVSEWGVNPILAPDGTALSTVEIVSGVEPVATPPAERRALPLATAVLVLMLAWVPPWPRWCSGLPGFAGSILAITFARWALLASHATSFLLPRTLGSPSLFGSSRAWGLAASPADLLLSATAIFLAIQAMGVLLRTPSARRLRLPGILLVAVAAIASAAGTFFVSISLARDCTVPVLHLGAAVRSPGHAVLLLSLALLLLSPAVAVSWFWMFRQGAGDVRPARRLVSFLLLPVAALAGATFLTAQDRLSLDRLQSEFGPQVLEQTPRRTVALRSAVSHAAARLAGLPAELRSTAGRNFLAYDLWVSSGLFQAGYKSSLTVLDESGAVLSHFGFDIPPLDETIEIPEGGGDGIVLDEEYAEPAAAARDRLIHAHLPVLRGGNVVAVVVGHVTDEPDNLPFLPGSRPYLGSLGVGGAVTGERDLFPEYVLYDAAGVVRYSTLSQPPAWKVEFDKAALEDRTVRLQAGGEPYTALPLLEGMDRLHLLLLPAPTDLERWSTFVRLLLLGLFLLAVLELARHLARPDGFGGLVAGLRGSFYRKLVAALLLASVMPLIGLSLVLRQYAERRGETALLDEALQRALVAQRVVEDYAGLQLPGADTEEPAFSDHLMSWLRRVVGHDIHLYENGVLAASSKRELFASGLLLPRLPGDVYRSILQENRPPMVVPSGLGMYTIPVAYAPVRLADPGRKIVLGVPMILQQQAIDRAVGRVVEILLLTTVFLAGLLVVAAALMARTVARPVRELAGATGRIADGDYDTRLPTRTRDEIADLVQGFNTMASALASQRADLLRRKDYMEALLRNATTGVVSTDSGGRIVTINPAAAGLLSSEKGAPGPGDDLAGAVALIAGLEPLAERLAAARATREPEEIDLGTEDRPVRLRLVRAELPDPEGGPSGTLVLLEDVTDLMRRNQLEAWAEMARAIAHEIKNPLTPIQLSTEHLDRLLRDRGLLPSPELESCLENVIRQVQALRQIASEFSAYAKLPDLKVRPEDPVEFLRETASPYRASPPPDVRIVEDYGECPRIPIDARVLSRAVINLIENALQSMPDGGTLTLASAVHDGGASVRLTVRDTGRGLSPEVRNRLFEPYFSTRSSGTGLGLAIVRRSVEAHGGTIEVDSEQGVGTSFHLLLPVAAES